MLLESTIPDGQVGQVGSGRSLDDNNTNSAQLELGLGLSLAIISYVTTSFKGRRCLQLCGHQNKPISCLVFCAIVKSGFLMFLTSEKIMCRGSFESESIM